MYTIWTHLWIDLLQAKSLPWCLRGDPVALNSARSFTLASLLHTFHCPLCLLLINSKYVSLRTL